MSIKYRLAQTVNVNSDISSEALKQYPRKGENKEINELNDNLESI